MSAQTATTLAATVMVVAGLLGVVIPVLPGPALIWGGVLVWAFPRGGAAWVVLALVTVLIVAGAVIKYALPGRRLRRSNVPWQSLALGAGLGIAGFFVIPVLGLPLGFAAGLYFAELQRLGDDATARRSTREALVALGWGMLIEFLAGLAAAAIWVGGVLLV